MIVSTVSLVAIFESPRGRISTSINLMTEIAIFTTRGAYLNCAIIAMLYTHSIGNQPWNTTVVFKMRDSVPSQRYSPVCNVLRQSKTSSLLIKTEKTFLK